MMLCLSHIHRSVPIDTLCFRDIYSVVTHTYMCEFVLFLFIVASSLLVCRFQLAIVCTMYMFLVNVCIFGAAITRHVSRHIRDYVCIRAVNAIFYQYTFHNIVATVFTNIFSKHANVK